MFFYFKSVKVYGVENVPKAKPVLFLGNHQNALLDALLIATKCKRFSYFLTRAAVFKKPLVSKILNSLQMLPVYRVRDGWNNLTNNNAIFDACTSLFKNNEAVVIFPEGSHNLARRVRPLSKGFTRIVFDTLEKHPDLDIQLIPVGLNFVNAKDFPDSAALYFGKPISAKSFVSEHRNEAVVNLKSKIKSELSNLTTNIPEDAYEEVLNKLDALNVNYLNPNEVNTCITSNFKDCIQNKKASNKNLKLVLKHLMIATLLLPYLAWQFIFKPKIKELEFTATFRLAVGLTLVPIYLLLIFVLLSLTFSLQIGLLYLLITIVITLLAVKL